MSNESGKHAEKHAKRVSIDPRDVTVTLSPEMQKTLEQVIPVLRLSKHVDEEVYDMARGLAAGKLDLLTALSTIRYITEDLEKHHRAEGVDVPHQWSDFLRDMATSSEAPQFTLVQAEKQRGRG